MDKFEPVAHDETFARRVMEKPGVKEAYDALGDEYALLRELLHARQYAAAVGCRMEVHQVPR